MRDKVFKSDLHSHMNAVSSTEEIEDFCVTHGVKVPLDWISNSVVDISSPEHAELKRKLEEKGYLTTGGAYKEFLDFSSLRPENKEEYTAKEWDVLTKFKNKYLELCSLPVSSLDTFNEMDHVYEFRDLVAKNKDPEIARLYILSMAQTLKKSGVKYTEFSYPAVLKDPFKLLELSANLEEAYNQTGVLMRVLASIPRTFPNDRKDKYAMMMDVIKDNPYVAGVDFLGQEINSSETFSDYVAYFVQKALEEDPDFVIRAHAGENNEQPDNVLKFLEAVEKGRLSYAQKHYVDPREVPYPPVRVGHGVYIGWDAQTRQKTKEMLKKTDAIVECNISSNLALNNIVNFSDVPMKEYLDEGIKIVLGTDGGGLYQTDIAQEMLLATGAGLDAKDLQKVSEIESAHLKRAYASFERKSQVFRQRFKIPQGPIFDKDGLEKYSKALSKANKEAHENPPKIGRPEHDVLCLEPRESLLTYLQRQGFVDAEKAVENDENVSKRKTPVMILGMDDWRTLAPADLKVLEKYLNAALRALDPDKTYLLTDGHADGVSPLVSRAAKKYGLTCVAALAADSAVLNGRIDPDADFYKECHYFFPGNDNKQTTLRNQYGRSDEMYRIAKEKGVLIMLGEDHQWQQDVYRDIHNRCMNDSVVFVAEPRFCKKTQKHCGYGVETPDDLLFALEKYMPHILAETPKTEENPVRDFSSIAELRDRFADRLPPALSETPVQKTTEPKTHDFSQISDLRNRFSDRLPQQLLEKPKQNYSKAQIKLYEKERKTKS